MTTFFYVPAAYNSLFYYDWQKIFTKIKKKLAWGINPANFFCNQTIKYEPTQH